MKKFVNTSSAKSEVYKKVLEDIDSQKVCPFCPETFKWHTKPILKRLGDWLITENFSPYKNTKYHLVVIGKVHKEKLSELTGKDWKSIFSLCDWAISKYKIKGGAITMRFGDSLYTGATVKHLHLHLISPEVLDGKVEPVYFPIG
jgi:ATP adenylyltransferase